MKLCSSFSVLIILLMGIAIPGFLQAKSDKNLYRNLPQPPITILSAVYPDKEVFDRGEIVTFRIVAQLDTLSCSPFCNYIVFIGNLSSLLTQSVLIDSEVQSSYVLNAENSIAQIAFQVKMLNKYSPPVIEIQSARQAPDNSTNKKSFMGIVIDEYATKYITSAAYAKVRSSDYGNTGY